MTELYLFFMFAAVFSFFIAYRIFTITYQITAEHLPASQACGSPAPYFGSAGNSHCLLSSQLGLVSIVIGLTIVGWKLRRVHDAYYIKSEFTLLMILALIFLPFYIVTVFVRGTAYTVGCWVILLCCNALAFVR